MELNPTQKDLVLKIAELLCNNDITDGRAKYWVERAAKLFPGSPAVYRLKVNSKLPLFYGLKSFQHLAGVFFACQLTQNAHWLNYRRIFGIKSNRCYFLCSLTFLSSFQESCSYRLSHAF